nr:hypothetical protein [Tanacetum cinerariifolium]
MLACSHYQNVSKQTRSHQDPRAWYETLANYLLENGFQRGKIDHTLFIKRQKGDILLVQIYVDDIVFGSTNKDLCKAFKKLMKDKFQMSSMGELTFFLVYKFTDGKSASTPIDTEKPLLKDPDGEDVDVHTYRYLKGKPHLGLWYPKDSPFNLVASSNSDYTGASLDRKSTTGGCQFLRCKLISWQCKKQTIVATSSTKAEYVAADKYVAKILRKFGLIDGKSASTPIDTEKPLLKDSDGEDVDVHTYRLMIGSLMYLTLSRPDIMFAVCACAHFQVTLKVTHLLAVKRIFRYLKGKPHLGLWYPKDSPFNLVAYSNSDYAGASLDKKSTTGDVNSLDAD